LEKGRSHSSKYQFNLKFIGLFKKYRVSSYCIKLNSQEGLSVDFYSHEGRGSTIQLYEDNDKWVLIDSNENIDEALIHQNDNFISYFKEYYIVYLYDKINSVFKVFTDANGVNQVFYSFKAEKLIISNLIFHLSKFINVSIVKEKLIEHFTLGYCLNQKTIFKNIQVFKKNKIYRLINQKFSIQKNNFNKYNGTINRHVSKKALYKKLESNLLPLDISDNLILGLTGGKDSRALLGLMLENDVKPKVSSFGASNSTDVLAAKQISERFNLSFKHVDLCSKSDFDYYSKRIAYFSSGLTTASYVDMLKFVDYSMGDKGIFVIGEGGECIRPFFADISTFENLLTPSYILDLIFDKHARKDFIEYFEKELNTDHKFGIDFYINQRLPGNFSKRAYALRAFCDLNVPFMKKDFRLNSKLLNDKEILSESFHNYLIVKKSLNFEAHDVNKDTQMWNTREDVFLDKLIMLAGDFNFEKYFFNPLKVDTIEYLIKVEKRSVYFLLRLISFMEFYQNVNHVDYFSNLETKLDTIRLKF
jgi:hypothetical protein